MSNESSEKPSESQPETPAKAETPPEPSDPTQPPRPRIQVGSRRGLKRVRSLRPTLSLEATDQGETRRAESESVESESTPPPSPPESHSPLAAPRPSAGEAPATAERSAPDRPASAPSEPATPPESAVVTQPASPPESAASRSDLSGAEGVSERSTATAPPAAPTMPSPPPPQLVPRTPIARPSRRDRLAPELEVEMQAALQDASLEQMMAAVETDESLEVGARRMATVVKVHGDDAFFSLGGGMEGVASIRELAEPPAVGQQMEVVVRGVNAEDGLWEVTFPGVSVRVEDWSDLTEGAVVESRVTGNNTGGLEVMLNHIRGFIPASQVALHRVEDFAEYVGEKLLCVVVEVNPRRRKLVLSRRAVLEREREEARKKLLEELAPGQSREGVVRKIQDFGAFVDLGGIDGLIHISQLSWDRVKHPSEVLSEGQQVKVRVESVDAQTGRIGLSYRNLLDHPWTGIGEKFPIGSIVPGVVSRIAKFGAFVKLAPGVEGLVHISELAHHHVQQVHNVVREGQEVEVKVLAVDAEAQRIGLSLRATSPEPETEPVATEEGEDQPPLRKPAIPKPSEPLKGGRDQSTGGERFGLTW